MTPNELRALIADAVETRLPEGWTVDTGFGSMVWVLPPGEGGSPLGIDVIVPVEG